MANDIDSTENGLLSMSLFMTKGLWHSNASFQNQVDKCLQSVMINKRTTHDIIWVIFATTYTVKGRSLKDHGLGYQYNIMHCLHTILCSKN